jgi:hypothetical protein
MQAGPLIDGNNEIGAKRRFGCARTWRLEIFALAPIAFLGSKMEVEAARSEADGMSLRLQSSRIEGSFRALSL